MEGLAAQVHNMFQHESFQVLSADIRSLFFPGRAPSLGGRTVSVTG